MTLAQSAAELTSALAARDSARVQALGAPLCADAGALQAVVDSLVGAAAVPEIALLFETLEPHLPPALFAWLKNAAPDLHAAGAFDAQARMLAMALRHFPDDAMLHYAQGQHSRMMGDMDGAIAHYETAHKLKPDFHMPTLGAAIAKMQKTGFREGLSDYEARFNNGADASWRAFPAARWQGESTTGKRIYIYAEQGLGDVVMWASFLPHLIAQHPARIVLGAFPKMVTLLERSFPEISVEPLQPAYDMELYKGLFDYVAPMGDLMVRLLPTHTPARTQASYLKADPARVSAAKAALARLPGRKIGISWFTTQNYNGVLRNIPLAEWMPLLQTPGCVFFSLQHGAKMEDIDRFKQKTNAPLFADPNLEPMRDIENLAALIASMDEVISAQNSNVHLGGALGVPTTLLLSRAGDFRWPPSGSDSAWYKNVAIERQETPMDWKPVMEKVAAQLRARAASN